MFDFTDAENLTNAYLHSFIYRKHRTLKIVLINFNGISLCFI